MLLWFVGTLVSLMMILVVYGVLFFVLLKGTDMVMSLTGWPVWYASPSVGLPMCLAIHKWWPIRNGGWNPPWKKKVVGD